jgi:hypothetical protein
VEYVLVQLLLVCHDSAYEPVALRSPKATGAMHIGDTDRNSLLVDTVFRIEQAQARVKDVKSPGQSR